MAAPAWQQAQNGNLNGGENDNRREEQSGGNQAHRYREAPVSGVKEIVGWAV